MKVDVREVQDFRYHLVKHATEIVMPTLPRNNAPLKANNIADVTPYERKIPVFGRA